MDELLNTQIKEAFYLAYGNKNYKYTPIRFGISDYKFVEFIKSLTDIEFKFVDFPSDRCFFLTDLKFTPKTKVPYSISKYTLMTLLYLNYEYSKAFSSGDFSGYFSSNAFERYIEYYQRSSQDNVACNYDIAAKLNYDLGIADCSSIPDMYFDEDDPFQPVVKLVENLFKTSAVKSTYIFDVNCSRLFSNTGDKLMSKMSFFFSVSDYINLRTNEIPRIYYNSFSNLMSHYNNETLNDIGKPCLYCNPTTELIAHYTLSNFTHFNNQIDLEILCRGQTVSLSKENVDNNLIKHNIEIGEKYV